MTRQKTNWGYIDWLEENMEESSAALSAGIVTIFPHAHMKPHIHFTEQVIYTLQGTGYSLINGEKIDMSQPHVILHWEASVIHEMYNEGDQEFKHLMVSCPDPLGFQKLSAEGTEHSDLSPEDAEEYLRVAVSGIRDHVLSNIHYSYVIFSASGMPVRRTSVFPEFCCRHCMEGISFQNAPCMKMYIPCPLPAMGRFECPYEVTVFYVPVLFRGAFLGYIQGGYVHMHSVHDESVYMTPQSSIQGAKMLLERISKALTDYCEIYHFKKQIQQQEIVLADTRQYQKVLMTSLKNAENTMTDLRINNHFLFNTLNQMASMALSGGMVSLYQSILDLSCLFSYAVQNTNRMVPLYKEFEYLDAYLKLQKLRYQDSLRLSYSIETDLNAWLVPFNFLMPVAENAFKHGFVRTDLKEFSFCVREAQGHLVFTMTNNGTPVSQASCLDIMEDMRNSAAHGLSMVYRKLQMICGDDFSVILRPGKPDGLEITITIPAQKGGYDYD